MPTQNVEGSFTATDAVTGQSVGLAMQQLWLTGEVLPIGARLWVEHQFRSSEDKSLEVVYSFPLPRDAALRRFLVKGQGFSVKSELKPVAEAEEAYEAGIEKGSLSALSLMHRDGIANLMLGNLGPGEAVTVKLEIVAGLEARDDGFRFRFPFTLAPSYQAQARTGLLQPGRGEIELPEEQFGDVILPVFSKDAENLHQVGFEVAVPMAADISDIASPSHGIRVSRNSERTARVSLAAESDLPNRDLVLEAKTTQTNTRIFAGIDRNGRGRFAAVVPSSSFGEPSQEPRRVVFVLDRSGSMNGAPLRQARRAIEACLGALSAEDRFALVAFDNSTDIFPAPESQTEPAAAGPLARVSKWLKPEPESESPIDSPAEPLCFGTKDARVAARQFLAGIEARGGTELGQALHTASLALGGQPGDIFLVTDGQVFGGEDILALVRGKGVRVHCMGIGSASQDRFLALLARQTGGVGRFLTPRERVDVAAVDLFASVCRPVAAKLEASVQGSSQSRIAPRPRTEVFPGSPLVLMGEYPPEGPGSIALRWEGAGQQHECEISVAPSDSPFAETLRLIQGARLITDLESQISSPGSPRSSRKAERRMDERAHKQLESLSLHYGLASRAAALVAIVERERDRQGELPETRVVAVGMPSDTDFSAYFDSSQFMASALNAGDASALVRFAPKMPATSPKPGSRSRGLRRPGGAGARMFHLLMSSDAPGEALDEEPETSETRLFALAQSLEPDGGMPGATQDERLLASTLALLSFLAEGHTPTSGAFRAHVGRLVAYLRKAGADNELVEQILRLAHEERPLPGEWHPAISHPRTWEEIRSAVESV